MSRLAHFCFAVVRLDETTPRLSSANQRIAKATVKHRCIPCLRALVDILKDVGDLPDSMPIRAGQCAR